VVRRRTMSHTDMGIVGATTDTFILFEKRCQAQPAGVAWVVKCGITCRPSPTCPQPLSSSKLGKPPGAADPSTSDHQPHWRPDRSTTTIESKTSTAAATVNNNFMYLFHIGIYLIISVSQNLRIFNEI
jgi:hypothetical protein